MRRFRLIVWWTTIASQGPFIAASAWLFGHLASPVVAACAALAWAIAMVVLLQGRVSLLLDDREVSPLRSLLERTYYAQWAGSVCSLPTSVVGVPLGLGLGLGIGASFAAVYAVSLLTAIYAVFIRPAWLRVREIDVEVPHLPSAFDGYRIAQLSDLHLGSMCPRGRVHRWMAVASGLEPDAIALTGDYVTSGTRFHEIAAEIFSELRARDGVFAVCGNHDDYGHGEPLRTALVRAKIRLLENEHVTLERDGESLVIAGVDDTMSRRADVDRTLSGIPEGRAVVVLAHDPGLFRRIAERRASLVLSGHTHWGQVALPFFEERVNLATRFYRNNAGICREGESTLYVHPGLGMTGPPLRFGVAPEITVLRLRAPKGA